MLNSQYLDSLNWKIAGKAGEGVMVSSKIFAKAVKRHGMQAFNYFEYPSLIKGGHQTGQVYASFDQASCQKRNLDLIIALDENGISQHIDELNENSVVIFNSNGASFDKSKYPDLAAQVVEVPIVDLAKETAGSQIAANIVAMGISSYFFGLDTQTFEDILREEFRVKGEEIIDKNLKAFEAGLAAAEKVGLSKNNLEKKLDSAILLTGNEAVGMGAVAAGLQYYSAYPMTPASGLMHYLAEQQAHYPLVVKHVEDEIGSINQALGAAFAGVRAMTGSAGGGFALMVESLSLAGVAEVPLVILEAQRPGPGTGMPTWSNQADLQYILRTGHGEFVRVVLTPGTVEEHFELTKQAFYLSEKYQIPVFILSDKYILESHQTMPTPVDAQTMPRQSMAVDLPTDGSFRRYKLTDNGISPRSVPGQANGLQLTNSYEHDEFGYATEESDMAVAQIDKRFKKVEQLLTEIPQPVLMGDENADITLVSWGSTINVTSQLIKQTDLSVNAIHLPCVWPFPAEAFKALAAKAKRLVMVEGNATGQAEQLIRQETGIEFAQKIRRYDGRPFYVEDLVEWIKKN